MIEKVEEDDAEEEYEKNWDVEMVEMSQRIEKFGEGGDQ